MYRAESAVLVGASEMEPRWSGKSVSPESSREPSLPPGDSGSLSSRMRSLSRDRIIRISFSSWATRESVRLRGRRLCGATKTQGFLPFAHRWHWLGVDGLGRQRTFKLLQDSQDLFSCGGVGWPVFGLPWEAEEISDMITRRVGRCQEEKERKRGPERVARPGD